MAHFAAGAAKVLTWSGTILVQCRRQPPVVVTAIAEAGGPGVGFAPVHPAIAIIATGPGVAGVCQPRDVQKCVV
ncbi:MAG: hypothetical protein ABL861_06330 [Nitrosomonas sp.]